LYGFARLRFNDDENNKRFKLFDTKTALIRELHVYGTLVAVNKEKKGASQHFGMGKKLLQKAEEIARNAGYENIVVISGVGVRNYYRARGYNLTDHGYMQKELLQSTQGTATPSTLYSVTSTHSVSALLGLFYMISIFFCIYTFVTDAIY
jgi:hypothetical protein